MTYVFVAVMVLLVLGGIAVVLMRADSAPFAGRDHTPLGDTSELAGSHDEHGRTVSPPDP